MASLDAIFHKEFNQMMQKRKGTLGMLNLHDIPLPPEAGTKFFIEKREKVYISTINDEYYGKLSNTEALLWGTRALQRRVYDHNSEFIRDSSGNYILKDVTCPHDCVAVISDMSIGVPNNYNPKEPFEYVDMITKKVGDKAIHKFVYLVPRKYCYKLKQTALIMTYSRHRVYYSGLSVALTNGSVVNLYIIPYKPSNVEHNYRILHCKTSIDFSEELTLIRDYWLKNGIMFNPSICGLNEPQKGRDNMAIEAIPGVVDTYERFDPNNSMEKEESLQEADYV